MKLVERNVHIDTVEFGSKTSVVKNTLIINRDELLSLIKESSGFEDVRIELALPGDNCRIVRVADVIEPRIKISGCGQVFPGIISPLEIVGDGETVCLKGVAVVETWQMASQVPMVIDMSGPIADISQFSRTNNIVLLAQPLKDMSESEYALALKRASLTMAKYLANAAIEVQTDDLVLYDLNNVREQRESELPRVAYICQIYSIQHLAETLVYGHNSRNIIPTIIHPNEFFDGAIVNLQYDNMSITETTYTYQNHPIIKELYKRHDKDLLFTGVVLRNAPVSLIDKERAAALSAKLAKVYLKADGVVLTKEGGGHPQLDLDFTSKKCEELGIKTVIAIVESLSLSSGGSVNDMTLFNSKTADALVSCGMEEQIEIPKLDKVIGDDLSDMQRIKEKEKTPGLSTDVFYQGGLLSNWSIRGILSQFGETFFSTKEY